MEQTINQSFVAKFKTLASEENVEALAARTFKQSVTALKGAINSMEGDTDDKQDALDQAKEKLENLVYNNGKVLGSSKSDRDQYVRNLISAENAVKEAEEALNSHNQTIEVLKGHLKNLTA